MGRGRGTGTWDWDSGTWDAGRWDAGTWDAGTWDAGTWDARSRVRDKQTIPEFVKYNFRYSRERCNMLEGLSGDATSKAFVKSKSTR